MAIALTCCPWDRFRARLIKKIATAGLEMSWNVPHKKLTKCLEKSRNVWKLSRNSTMAWENEFSHWKKRSTHTKLFPAIWKTLLKFVSHWFEFLRSCVFLTAQCSWSVTTAKIMWSISEVIYFLLTCLAIETAGNVSMENEFCLSSRNRRWKVLFYSSTIWSHLHNGIKRPRSAVFLAPKSCCSVKIVDQGKLHSH